MDIKEYRKAIRALLKESKEEKAALSEARVITRKLKSGEPPKGGDSALERVSSRTGQSKPDDAEVKPHVTRASYRKRRQSNAEWSIEDGEWRRGADTRNQIATDARKKPNRHQRKRMTKKASEEQDEAPKKQNEARKEAWLNAFESILLEFDPRHEKRETSKRPGARREQISGSLAADYAKDQEERKSDRDLSSKEEI